MRSRFDLTDLASKEELSDQIVTSTLYDTAFIFSHDTDLLPAIELVKNNISFKDLKLICVTFDPLSEHRKHYHHIVVPTLKMFRDCYEPELHKPEETDLQRLAEKFKRK